MEKHALLPVVPENICIDHDCGLRRGLKGRRLLWCLVQSYSAVAILILGSCFVGAIISQKVVSAQYDPVNKQVHDAIEHTKLLDSVDNLKAEIAELKRANELLGTKIAELERKQVTMEDIGLALGVLISLFAVIRMIAGKKLKEP